MSDEASPLLPARRAPQAGRRVVGGPSMWLHALPYGLFLSLRGLARTRFHLVHDGGGAGGRGGDLGGGDGVQDAVFLPFPWFLRLGARRDLVHQSPVGPTMAELLASDAVAARAL